jgi:GAF domain-containing protein
MTNPEPIEPGDAFAQLSRINVGETSLREVFQRVVDLARLTFPEVTQASVTLVRGDEAHSPACTGDLARALDEAQYELGHGPCLQAASATTIEFVSDMVTESRWPDWTARALAAGARSSLSVGLPIRDTVSGALNLYATTPHAFDDDDVAVAQALGSYASLAMANAYLDAAKMTLSKHIEAALNSGAVIEQAKGIIMGDRCCSAEEAFVILTAMARDLDRKTSDVAQAMVDRVTGPLRAVG